ncbi:MAG: SDR family oxidoreductase [Acidobacteriota bacterium]
MNDAQGHPLLEGSRVLLTGATGGIGRETAKVLAAAGARLALQTRTQQEAALKLAEELPNGPHAVGVADLRSEAETQALFAAAAEKLGGLDGLVVNAGVYKPTVPAWELELEQWRDTLAVNLEGAFLCCREFLRCLRDRPTDRASIVLIGSTASVFGEAGHVDYSVSKAGLGGLLRTLKNEIGQLCALGRINLVHPGWVVTPMAEEALAEPGAVERITQTMPLRKVATPADVAGAILYFLSPTLSGHVSGSELTVAGGMEGRVLHRP